MQQECGTTGMSGYSEQKVIPSDVLEFITVIKHESS